jgi:hypothetical protein
VNSDPAYAEATAGQVGERRGKSEEQGGRRKGIGDYAVPTSSASSGFLEQFAKAASGFITIDLTRRHVEHQFFPFGAVR